MSAEDSAITTYAKRASCYCAAVGTAISHFDASATAFAAIADAAGWDFVDATAVGAIFTTALEQRRSTDRNPRFFGWFFADVGTHAHVFATPQDKG